MSKTQMGDHHFSVPQIRAGFNIEGAPDPVDHAGAIMHYQDPVSGAFISETVAAYAARGFWNSEGRFWTGPWVEQAPSRKL